MRFTNNAAARTRSPATPAPAPLTWSGGRVGGLKKKHFRVILWTDENRKSFRPLSTKRMSGLCDMSLVCNTEEHYIYRQRKLLQKKAMEAICCRQIIFNELFFIRSHKKRKVFAKRFEKVKFQDLSTSTPRLDSTLICYTNQTLKILGKLLIIPLLHLCYIKCILFWLLIRLANRQCMRHIWCSSSSLWHTCWSGWRCEFVAVRADWAAMRFAETIWNTATINDFPGADWCDDERRAAMRCEEMHR